MSNAAMLINPVSETNKEYVSCVNDSGGTLVHGDVVTRDLTKLAALAAASSEIGSFVETTASANSKHVVGVVDDPSGLGIPDGSRCNVQTKGYHNAVRVNGTVTAGTHHLETTASAGRATGVAFASMATKALIGWPITTNAAGDGTVAAILDVG